MNKDDTLEFLKGRVSPNTFDMISNSLSDIDEGSFFDVDEVLNVIQKYHNSNRINAILVDVGVYRFVEE